MKAIEVKDGLTVGDAMEAYKNRGIITKFKSGRISQYIPVGRTA